jgi:hypothetical protein
MFERDAIVTRCDVGSLFNHHTARVPDRPKTKTTAHQDKADRSQTKTTAHKRGPPLTNEDRRPQTETTAHKRRLPRREQRRGNQTTNDICRSSSLFISISKVSTSTHLLPSHLTSLRHMTRTQDDHATPRHKKATRTRRVE